MICVVGPSCAGKTTISQWLESNLGYTYIEASDFAVARYKADGSSEPIIEYVGRVFKERGRHTFAMDVANHIISAGLDPTTVALSGFRATEEIDYMRGLFGSVDVFGVYASSSIRFRRSQRRLRQDAPVTYVEFVLKDMKEYEFGIAKCLSHYAQQIIINEGSLEELYSTVEKGFNPKS